jgi:hypothetical protein
VVNRTVVPCEFDAVTSEPRSHAFQAPEQRRFIAALAASHDANCLRFREQAAHVRANKRGSEKDALEAIATQ